jgi:hypothetical protein
MAQIGMPGDDDQRLQLRVVNEAGSVTGLDEWMSFVGAELRRQGIMITQLGRQSAEISQELSALNSSLAESRLMAQGMRGDAADLRQRLDDLDRRLNNILALFETRLGGGQTEQGMQHHDYAQQYIALVEQKIMSLALDTVPGGAHATPREKAEFVALMCADLFGAAEIAEQQLIGRLPESAAASVLHRIRDICAEARTLRAKIAQGRPQRWEFNCELGVPVNAEWQEPWTGAAYDGMVEFVVAPAYVVDSGTLLMKQRVFTGAAGTAAGAAARNPDPAEG